MKLHLLIAISFLPFVGYFGGYGVFKELKSDSLGKLLIPNCDTNIIVYISSNLNEYKLYDRKLNLISDGNLGSRISVDVFRRFGKWTTYFSETGKPKVVGYFYDDRPTGLWRYFYPNGQLRQLFSLTLLLYDF